MSDASFGQPGTLVCASAAVSNPASVTSATCTSSTLATGTHSITARYSGDGNNLPPTATALSQVVNPENQTITFGAAPTLVAGGTGTVTATATSGLAVSYSTASAACTVNLTSGLVNAVAAGSCVIAANQPGNGNYNAALQQTQSITATAAPSPILDIDDSAPNTKYDAATDGLLLMRYLLGLRGTALTDGALGIGASRDATQIAQYLTTNRLLFDVDGDGLTLATTDGVMILRRLLGITNAAAITQGAKNSSLSDAHVVTAIDALKP